MLWLSVRWKITSEFSWASVKCDWQWPALQGRGVKYRLPSTFSVWGKPFCFWPRVQAGIIVLRQWLFSPFLFDYFERMFIFEWDRLLSDSNNRTAIGAEIFLPLHEGCRWVCVQGPDGKRKRKSPSHPFVWCSDAKATCDDTFPSWLLSPVPAHSHTGTLVIRDFSLHCE